MSGKRGIICFGMMGRRGMSSTEECPHRTHFGKANEVRSVGAIMVSIKEVLFVGMEGVLAMSDERRSRG